MIEIEKLLSKRDALLIQIACIVQDLNEYIKYPVETVSVDQLHYQYDFTIREIQKIDNAINSLFTKQCWFFVSQNKDLKQLTDKATSTIVFTVKDLPRHHWTMFQDLNPINE